MQLDAVADDEVVAACEAAVNLAGGGDDEIYLSGEFDDSLATIVAEMQMTTDVVRWNADADGLLVIAIRSEAALAAVDSVLLFASIVAAVGDFAVVGAE